MSLESAWTNWCKLFGKLEGAAAIEDFKAVGELSSRLRNIHPEHPADAEHLANVLSALHRGIPLLQAALGWADVRAGGSRDRATLTDEVRGEQWRLVMAYGGFETVCKALLSWPGKSGLGLREFKRLTEACDLPPYPTLKAPSHPPKVRERWFETPQDQAPDELARFLGLGEGAARAVRAWLVEGKAVSDWADALDLARAFRHAIAHGALSAHRAADWRVQRALRRLVTDLATVASAALDRVTADHERPSPVATDVAAGTGGRKATRPGKIILPGDPEVSDLALSRGGRLLACGVDDRRVILVDLQAGQATGLLKVGGRDTDDRVNNTSVAFSPEKELLAAGAGKDVWLWRLDPSGQPQGRATRLPADESISESARRNAEVSAVRFSPDGRLLAVAFVGMGYDEPIPQVFVFDVATGQPAGTLSVPKRLGAQADPVEIAFFHGSPGLAAISWGLKICRWPVPGARALWAVRHPDMRGSYRWIRRYGIAVSPDDTQVAVGTGHSARVHLLDASSGASVRTLTTTTNWVSSVAYSPDGKRLVAGTTFRGGAVEVFDLTSRAASAFRRVEILGEDGGDLNGLSLTLDAASGLVVVGTRDNVQVFRSGLML